MKTIARCPRSAQIRAAWVNGRQEILSGRRYGRVAAICSGDVPLPRGIGQLIIDDRQSYVRIVIKYNIRPVRRRAVD
jgi:hypothetical protein